MFIAGSPTAIPPAPFGGAELKLTGIHQVTFRPSERRRSFVMCETINISLLRSEDLKLRQQVPE